MKKIIWIFLVLVPFVLSLIISFNQLTLLDFFNKLVFYFAAFFLFLLFLIKAIYYIKHKYFLKATLYTVLILVLVVAYFFMNFYFFSGGTQCLAMIQPHFRENIFTGKCEIARTACGLENNGDPWYWKEGCDSETERELFIERIKSLEIINEECNSFCTNKNSTGFCERGLHEIPFNWIAVIPSNSGDLGVRNCNDVFSCETISCET